MTARNTPFRSLIPSAGQGPSTSSSRPSAVPAEYSRDSTAGRLRDQYSTRARQSGLQLQDRSLKIQCNPQGGNRDSADLEIGGETDESAKINHLKSFNDLMAGKTPSHRPEINTIANAKSSPEDVLENPHQTAKPALPNATSKGAVNSRGDVFPSENSSAIPAATQMGRPRSMSRWIVQSRDSVPRKEHTQNILASPLSPQTAVPPEEESAGKSEGTRRKPSIRTTSRYPAMMIPQKSAADPPQSTRVVSARAEGCNGKENRFQVKIPSARSPTARFSTLLKYALRPHAGSIERQSLAKPCSRPDIRWARARAGKVWAVRPPSRSSPGRTRFLIRRAWTR